MTRGRLLVGVAALAVATAASSTAQAQSYSFSFSGPGVWGSIVLSYGAMTDAKYPGAHEVTGISGWFNDTNNGLNISNASITGLVPINHATPDAPLASRAVFGQTRDVQRSAGALRREWRRGVRETGAPSNDGVTATRSLCATTSRRHASGVPLSGSVAERLPSSLDSPAARRRISSHHASRFAMSRSKPNGPGS